MTIPDDTLQAVEAAAKASGKSVSAWVADAADVAAVRAAAARFRAALAANPADAAEHRDAVEFALANGRKAMQRAVERLEADAA